MRKVHRYARRLIEFDTTSHKSNRLACKYIEMKLAKHGFVVEKVDYLDKNRQRKINLIAKKGAGVGGLAYFGHIDTVPADFWTFERAGPFEPTVFNERLYGRGACDMKGSVACMMDASQQFDWDQLKQPFYFVITADEEIGFLGAKAVVKESEFYREMVENRTKAIIGEPTGLDVVHAHKGSLTLMAHSKGQEAHSSSRAGKNANLAMIPFLNELLAIHEVTEQDSNWHDNDFDPPTLSLNIGIRDSSTALNIKAGGSTATAYLRPMPGVNVEPILERLKSTADRLGIELTISRSCEPFWKNPNSEFVRQTLKLLHRQSSKTVCYATDAGVLVDLPDKIVLGPGNIAQAHTADEWISLEQLERGTEVYAKLIQHWCCQE
ncbi:MAG: M20/M25/M40 family metallo-hydrolase [Pirellulaceae bacterium]